MVLMESLQGEEEGDDLHFDVGARLEWLGDRESKKKERTIRKTQVAGLGWKMKMEEEGDGFLFISK